MGLVWFRLNYDSVERQTDCMLWVQSRLLVVPADYSDIDRVQSRPEHERIYHASALVHSSSARLPLSDIFIFCLDWI